MLADLNFRNLDEVAAFSGRNTTTEFLRACVRRIAAAVARGELGGSARASRACGHAARIALASASYEAPLS